MRVAGVRYQKSLIGKHKHALRQQNYRKRQINKVTHQGSLNTHNNDLLPIAPKNNKKDGISATYENIICDFCNKKCSKFLRRHARYMKSILSSWPSGP